MISVMILPVSRAWGKETCPWGLPAEQQEGHSCRHAITQSLSISCLTVRRKERMLQPRKCPHPDPTLAALHTWSRNQNLHLAFSGEHQGALDTPRPGLVVLRGALHLAPTAAPCPSGVQWPPHHHRANTQCLPNPSSSQERRMQDCRAPPSPLAAIRPWSQPGFSSEASVLQFPGLRGSQSEQLLVLRSR